MRPVSGKYGNGELGMVGLSFGMQGFEKPGRHGILEARLWEACH